MAPFTAQVMTTFRASAIASSLVACGLCCHAFVGDQRHQALVAPFLALREIALRKRGTAALLHESKHWSRPVHAPHLRWRDPLVDPLISLHVVAYAARRIQVDGLEWSHETPPEGESVAEAGIDILRRGIAVGDQPEGFLQERALHPVHHEAVELALHDDRPLADPFHQGGGFARDRLGRPGRGHDLSCGHEIGGIARMTDEPALARRKMFAEARWKKRGGRCGED